MHNHLNAGIDKGIIISLGTLGGLGAIANSTLPYVLRGLTFILYFAASAVIAKIVTVLWSKIFPPKKEEPKPNHNLSAAIVTLIKHQHEEIERLKSELKNDCQKGQ